MMVTFRCLAFIKSLNCPQEARFSSLYHCHNKPTKIHTVSLPIDPTTIQITPFLIHQLQPISYVNTFYISS